MGFEGGSLHLHLHAEGPLALFGGGTAPAGEYEPSDLQIGVPGPAISRPTGGQWDFLGPEGSSLWVLSQSSMADRPFLGIGTEELLVEDGWDTPLTWTFNSITTVSGEASEFALWQNDGFGNPAVRASSAVPTASGNSWTQLAFSHDHFNYGFTGQGVYDVNFTIFGTNSILNESFSDTASFRFVTGNAIAVPEPSGIALLGIFAAGSVYHRRRRIR